MTEENSTPTPKWMTELKSWGIDVEAFDAKWQQSGEDAKAQFREALANAAAEYEADQAEMAAAVESVREDAKKFVQQMGTAWDEMVASIHEELNPKKQDGDNAES